MPILFFIDPDFENDPKMKDVDSITLSYTFWCSRETFEDVVAEQPPSTAGEAL